MLKCTLIVLLASGCRLAAAATCRAWRGALRGLPLRRLDLGSRRGDAAPRDAKLQWAITSRPAATAVCLEASSEQSTLALHSLKRKVWYRCRLGIHTRCATLCHCGVAPTTFR